MNFFRVIRKRVLSLVLKKWSALRFSTVSRKRQRIIGLDILRGLFLVTLIVNHLPWTPSLYSFFTGKSDLFASAAEGFFVVSGILVGYIYGQKMIGSARETFKRIWKRGLVLALLSIGGTLLYTYLAISSPTNYVGLEPWSGTIQRYLLNTFSLRYSYGWIDFLNRYAIFMFAAPFALWLVSRNKAWIVLFSSAIVWLFLRDVAYFAPFAAWQLIFMGGLIIGYYLPEIENYAKSLTPKQQSRGVKIVMSLAISTYLLSIVWSVLVPFIVSNYTTQLPNSILLVFIELMEYRASIWESWFSKSSLEIGRLAIGSLWFAALYIFVRSYESKIVSWRLGVAIEYIGKHSLFVYVLHGIVIVLVNFLLAPPEGYMNLFVNTIIVTFIVWFIYQVVARRHIFDSLVTRSRSRIKREDF